MRCVAILLGVCLLLACPPAGALAGTALWAYSAPSEITGLSMTPDGSYVLIGGGRLCFLAGNGTPLWQEWTAKMTACSADGGLIAAASGSSLALLDRNATVIWQKEAPSTWVTLALSPNGKRVAMADLAGKVYFYDADGTLRAMADTRSEDKNETGVYARSEIRGVAFSDGGEYAAVVSSRGLFYYTGAGRKVWAHEGGPEGGTAVAVSGTGNEVAAASDASVRLLNRTGGLLWTSRCSRPVTALAISQDGSRVLAGLQDNSLVCFDRAGEQVWNFTAGAWIRDIAVSKNGSRVLAGSLDRQAYLFDGAGHLLDTYSLDGGIEHVALTADGTAGVAASLHKVIGISTAVVTATPTAPRTSTPAPAAVTPTAPGTVTPAPVTTTPAVPVQETMTPAPAPDRDSGLPLLPIVGLLACSTVLGAGYLYRQHRQPPPTPEEVAPEAPTEVVEAPSPFASLQGPEPAPWRVSLDRGRTREAARILSREMTVLIKQRTGVRIIYTADALNACPGQRQDLARFFEDANRLAYASGNPTREDIEALEAAYLRLAEEISGGSRVD